MPAGALVPGIDEPNLRSPEAVASAALFLAADDSRMITKHCLLVDAGMR